MYLKGNMSLIHWRPNNSLSVANKQTQSCGTIGWPRSSRDAAYRATAMLLHNQIHAQKLKK